MKYELILSLGSNIEPRRIYLNEAIKELNKIFVFNKISSLYQSEAVEYTEQGDFYNICASYYTEMNDPFEILDKILEIEVLLGRKRDKNKPKGPRTIDIDILLFGDYEVNSERLTIPHKSMFERKFVLVPLMEVLSEESIYFTKYDLYHFLDKVKMQRIENIGALLS